MSKPTFFARRLWSHIRELRIKHNDAERQSAAPWGRVREPDSAISFPDRSSDDAIVAFVEDRLRFAIAAEARFRLWAAIDGDAKALKTVHHWDFSGTSEWIDVDDLLVWEIRCLNVRLDYFADRVNQLELELSQVYATTGGS